VYFAVGDGIGKVHGLGAVHGCGGEGEILRSICIYGRYL
jgi:hypothetical protein